ncbi:hypothetical protein KI387_031715, partial [Taxus chinensis]
MWVAGIDDVSEVGSEVELMNWEADGLAVEVVAVVGMEDVGVVKVAAALVRGGVGEEVVVVEVDALM